MTRTTEPAERRQLGTEVRPRFDCFDGLRAIAAIAVVFHHTGFATAATFRDWHGTGDFLARADIGVSIFFLISGFLLYRPFVAMHLADRPRPATGAYFRRRFLRIFPAYWAALIGIALFIGFYQGQELNGVWSWISHLALVQVYQPDQFFRGITQTWTLHVELSFYLFLPVYAWALRRVAARTGIRDHLRVEVAGLAVLAAVGVVSNVAIQWGGWLYLSRVGKAWLPANLDLFAIGMTLAVVSAWASRQGSMPPIVERLGRIGGWWWLGAGAAFWIVSKEVGISTAITRVPDTGIERFVEHYLYGLVGLFLLLPAVFGTARKGAVRSFLRLGPVVWLGLISYGIYLWHQGWIKEALQWTDSSVPEGQLIRGPFWVVLGITLACTIVTAAVSYYGLERPVLRLKDRTLSRRRTHRV
ncbi:MAG TPA: acyltransferase [Acidimicrobiia bacterium]|nr:acyltransferase [Acidimicrobiia bacterium]